MERIVILYVGESFRSGNQGTRMIGGGDSYREQMEAIESHCKMMRELKEKKSYTIDIYTDI